MISSGWTVGLEFHCCITSKSCKAHTGTPLSWYALTTGLGERHARMPLALPLAAQLFVHALTAAVEVITSSWRLYSCHSSKSCEAHSANQLFLHALNFAVQVAKLCWRHCR